MYTALAVGGHDLVMLVTRLRVVSREFAPLNVGPVTNSSFHDKLPSEMIRQVAHRYGATMLVWDNAREVKTPRENEVKRAIHQVATYQFIMPTTRAEDYYPLIKEVEDIMRSQANDYISHHHGMLVDFLVGGTYGSSVLGEYLLAFHFCAGLNGKKLRHTILFEPITKPRMSERIVPQLAIRRALLLVKCMPEAEAGEEGWKAIIYYVSAAHGGLHSEHIATVPFDASDASVLPFSQNFTSSLLTPPVCHSGTTIKNIVEAACNFIKHREKALEESEEVEEVDEKETEVEEVAD